MIKLNQLYVGIINFIINPITHGITTLLAPLINNHINLFLLVSMHLAAYGAMNRNTLAIEIIVLEQTIE